MDTTALKKHFAFGAWEAGDRVPHLCPGLPCSGETKDDTAEEPAARAASGEMPSGTVMDSVSDTNACLPT